MSEGLGKKTAQKPNEESNSTFHLVHIEESISQTPAGTKRGRQPVSATPTSKPRRSIGINIKNQGCKDRTLIDEPVSKNTRAAKKRNITNQAELTDPNGGNNQMRAVSFRGHRRAAPGKK